MSPPSIDRKRPPHPYELERLEILKCLAKIRCRRIGCRMPWCRRTGRCRVIEGIDRRFALADGIDTKTSWRLVFALRMATQPTTDDHVSAPAPARTQDSDGQPDGGSD